MFLACKEFLFKDLHLTENLYNDNPEATTYF